MKDVKMVDLIKSACEKLLSDCKKAETMPLGHLILEEEPSFLTEDELTAMIGELNIHAMHLALEDMRRELL